MKPHRAKFKLAFLFLLLCLCSCKVNRDFYWGYVYYDQKPLTDVTVKTNSDNVVDSVQTDAIGFFKLAKQPHSAQPLIFKKEGFITDTIPSIWYQHGEKVMYTFLNQQPDTVLLRK
ncbi:hypothetical protein [Fulvivirga sediminis]|uniref:Carboxypeptidase regulatory-like domain-containing protein n=1 Tax=Fulvivirga sediminis TaxID=2803949 RepID=A0A937FAD9_9BACT|nr:hypothetical protein [Fulvivirga sediminis]MBL3657554.1 hypothetical protein [Fulvivirga sediminis]